VSSYTYEVDLFNSGIDHLEIMSRQTRIQHYVPRFYLKRFTVEEGKRSSLNCFDKLTSKVFSVDIRKIGCEKYFYDPSARPRQSVESALAKLDSRFRTSYDKLVKHGHLQCLASGDRVSLSFFVATQLVRTRETRETIRDVAKQLMQKLCLTGRMREKFERYQAGPNYEELVRSVHLGVMKDAPILANIINSMKWILIEDKTEMPFWTSDHPVAIYNAVDLSPYGNLGLLCKGVEMHLPLSPQLNLCMCDPVMYNLLSEKYETTEIQNIVFQNWLQVKWATRHIFSSSQDFTLAQQILEEDPKLRCIDRKRVKAD